MASEEGRLELAADPNGLAPERLLVFEVRGSIQNFVRAASRIPGLEFVGEEELEPEEEDREPVLYLMVPNAVALTQILSLWTRWQRGEELGRGFAPWRNLFGLLRDLRPWGPQDRLNPQDADYINEELVQAGPRGRVRLELEMVFRRDEAVATAAEAQLRRELELKDAGVVSRSRIANIAYHALLVDLPALAVQEILDRLPASLASAEPIMFIRPQSLATKLDITDAADLLPSEPAGELGDPILALLDGVPVAQHPLLANRLIVDDIFGLEAVTDVAHRLHGTAMASIITQGDRHRAEECLPRRIFVTPVLSGNSEEFPSDRLIVDLIYQSVLSLRGGEDPSAPNVLLINVSLGNRRKSFDHQVSDRDFKTASNLMLFLMAHVSI